MILGCDSFPRGHSRNNFWWPRSGKRSVQKCRLSDHVRELLWWGSASWRVAGSRRLKYGPSRDFFQEKHRCQAVCPRSCLEFLPPSHHRPRGLAALLTRVSQGDPFETAFAKALGTSISVEEKAWKAGLTHRYGWIPIATSESFFWLCTALLCVVAFVFQRRHTALRRAALAAQEAAEDAGSAFTSEEANPQTSPQLNSPEDDDSVPDKRLLH